MSNVVEWQKDGYIDPVIWEHLSTKINPSMLPQPPQLPPYPLEEPHTEKDGRSNCYIIMFINFVLFQRETKNLPLLAVQFILYSIINTAFSNVISAKL